MDFRTMIATEFVERHALDAARILERHSADEITVFLENAPAVPAARVLTVMDTTVAVTCLGRMRDEPGATLLGEIPFEIAALYLRIMEEPRRRALIGLLPLERGSALESVLRYPEGSAGSIMDPLVFTVPVDLAVRDLLERLRQREYHVLDYVFVVDRRNALAGYLSLRDLMVTDPESAVASVMFTCDAFLSPAASIDSVMNHPAWSEFRVLSVLDDEGVLTGQIPLQTIAVSQLDTSLGNLVKRQPVSIEAFSPREDIAGLLEARKLASLPVVDVNGRLLGIIRYGALISATQQEASEDVQAMFGAGLSGAVIPVILKSIGQDPAQSSSIILTTVTDVVGFLSFLGLATVLAGALGIG